MKLKDQKRSKTIEGPWAKYWIVAIGTMGMLIAYCPASHNIVFGKVRLDKDTARRRNTAANRV